MVPAPGSAHGLRAAVNSGFTFPLNHPILDPMNPKHQLTKTWKWMAGLSGKQKAAGGIGVLIIIAALSPNTDKSPATTTQAAPAVAVAASDPPATTAPAVAPVAVTAAPVVPAAPATTAAPTTTTAKPFKNTTEARMSLTACSKFRSTAGKISRVELTPEEMRKEFKTINDRAIIATPAVQAAAGDLVAAGTLFYVSPSTDTSQAIIAAATKMDAACTEAGH
jgi:hypothetical protein